MQSMENLLKAAFVGLVVVLGVMVYKDVKGAERSAPSSTALSQPADGLFQDRHSCDEIKGTDYRSDTERGWFLGNCPAPVRAPAPGTNTSPPVIEQAGSATIAKASPPSISSLGCDYSIVETGSQVNCNPVVGGQVAAWRWTGGQLPDTATNATFSTRFESVGSRTITLTVCNPSGCASASTVVSVISRYCSGPQCPR